MVATGAARDLLVQQFDKMFLPFIFSTLENWKTVFNWDHDYAF